MCIEAHFRAHFTVIFKLNYILCVYLQRHLFVFARLWTNENTGANESRISFHQLDKRQKKRFKVQKSSLIFYRILLILCSFIYLFCVSFDEYPTHTTE